MTQLNKNEQIILEMYEKGNSTAEIRNSGLVLNKKGKPVTLRYIQLVLKEYEPNRPIGKASRVKLFTYEEVIQMCNSKKTRYNIAEQRFKEYYISRKGLRRSEFLLKVLSRDSFKCVECGSFIDLECHHNSYDNVGTNSEVSDCKTLCRVCHLEIHNEVLK